MTWPRQELGHPRRRNARCQSLGQIAVAPRGEDALLVAFHRVRRQGDDWQVGGGGLALEHPGRLQPVHPRRLIKNTIRIHKRLRIVRRHRGAACADGGLRAHSAAPRTTKSASV